MYGAYGFQEREHDASHAHILTKHESKEECVKEEGKRRRWQPQEDCACKVAPPIDTQSNQNGILLVFFFFTHPFNIEFSKFNTIRFRERERERKQQNHCICTEYTFHLCVCVWCEWILRYGAKRFDALAPLLSLSFSLWMAAVVVSSGRYQQKQQQQPLHIHTHTIALPHQHTLLHSFIYVYSQYLIWCVSHHKKKHNRFHTNWFLHSRNSISTHLFTH